MEERWEAVQRMQDFVSRHAGDAPFDWKGFYAAACYSRRHADRIFQELTGETPRSYVKKVALTKSAQELAGHSTSVLEAALSSGYDTHEGYTRAFSRFFGVVPSEYRRENTPIPLFIQYPVRERYFHDLAKEEKGMNDAWLCTVTPVERPARKLVFLRSRNAEDYWTYCEEMGCGWEGLFNSIPQKLDTAAIMELPEFLWKEGFSKVAAGGEVPADYSARLPEGWEEAELSPCTLLYFQSEPYETEEKFGQAIESVFRAVEKYDPTRFGYQWAPEAGPSFNFGTEASIGARQAYPVKRP